MYLVKLCKKNLHSHGTNLLSFTFFSYHLSSVCVFHPCCVLSCCFSSTLKRDVGPTAHHTQCLTGVQMWIKLVPGFEGDWGIKQFHTARKPEWHQHVLYMINPVLHPSSAVFLLCSAGLYTCINIIISITFFFMMKAHGGNGENGFILSSDYPSLFQYIYDHRLLALNTHLNIRLILRKHV